MAADFQPTENIRRAGGGNVGRIFATQARRFPNDIALVDGANGDESLTYAQLNKRVNQLAHVMLERGVGVGDRVGLLSRNCGPFIEVDLAAAKIGAITTSLNWRLAPTELHHCIALTTPSLMFTQDVYLPALEGTKPTRLVFGPEYEAALAAAPDGEPAVDAGGEDGMLIIFTSGTTGLPKGALISHRAMIARTGIYGAEMNAPAKDTFAAWTPLFHMGANDFALATLMRGGKVITIDGYQPQAMVAAIEGEAMHYLPLIPGMIMEFIDVLRDGNVQPKGIGMIGAMADLVPRQQLAEITTLLDAPYLNTFGSTETGTPPATASFVAIGSAPTSLSKTQNDFCEIRLVDADDNEVADGEPGELAIRGPSLFSGYWNNDEANAEAFRGGWFHMGDVFRRNTDGSLDFVDRVKYMIKSGGENIYPAEIEQYILADPRVADAAVVRKSDAKWGEVPVVFAARREAGLTAEDLIATCAGKLARYKLPKEVHFIDFDDFPRSTTGKIQRHELEARLEP
ncbi:MAG: AMP-binding protein [Rhodospirillaceae bacterium]|jgi:fatty-acyl-CoA synthase|nr:AMP-binding protein [Rhodospirillaceae bacterium]MBT5522785.1 AMP-binding protein [Rhodospirillaceae bacterium]MBT5880980.1 AMP-binding protein [Rhodospirillaceae bacterium]MBT6592088.1 AMP-binding protein [Rhodospirillaceae bacterium]MBT6985198.1 AMP-binding protein [Rhodospirillaceae bacterium]